MNLKFDEKEQFTGFILKSEANNKANGRNVKRSLIHARKKSEIFKRVGLRGLVLTDPCQNT